MKSEITIELDRSPALLISGLDSLYVCYYLDFQWSDIDFDKLSYQKECLRSSAVDDIAEIELGSETFALRPYGRHPYRYILANDVFEVRLAEHLRPNFYVQFYSKGLWMAGLDDMLARFHNWCVSMKLDTEREEVISRADWAFDYNLSQMDFEPDHFLTKAAKKAAWWEYNDYQTISFGTGHTVVRVYDKVAEIKQRSAKAWFFELWRQEQNVWRIEFQIRRERLKRAGINSIKELKDLQNDLLRELAVTHTTLRRPSRDSNKSRWPLHPLWKQLQRNILELPQTGLIRDIDPAQPLNWRIYQQSKSLHGTLKGMAVLLYAKGNFDDVPSLDSVIEALPEVLRTHHQKTIWKRDIEKRRKAFELGQW